MRFQLRPLAERWARRVQVLYADAIRGAAPPERGGIAGGSLARRVLSPALVTIKRWGFVFTPTKLGHAFRFWWFGTARQRKRGRPVAIDRNRMALELKRELARQLRRADRS